MMVSGPPMLLPALLSVMADASLWLPGASVLPTRLTTTLVCVAKP